MTKLRQSRWAERNTAKSNERTTAIRSRKRVPARVCALVCACLLAIRSPFPAAAAEMPREYIKAATYVSDAWVINFWNTESDHMEEELAQIAADGFNTIILVVPWREFQPGLSPVSYNDYAFQKFERVMKAARDQGLWVSLRVSYTWDYYEAEESLVRFRELLGNSNVREAWLKYLQKIYQTASEYDNFCGGFITWEDFWNYMEDAGSFGTGDKSLSEAKRIGYQDYLREHYSLERINDLYGREFQDYDEIHIPQRNNPAYKLLYEYYDEFLIGLLADGQQMFPNLSMEVRLDIDPVEDGKGGRVGANHFKTFPCGGADYTSLMYSVAMGQENQGEKITSANAIAAMKRQLNMAKAANEGKTIFIDQLLYMDSTEEFAQNAQLYEEERNVFLLELPKVLRQYTNGYGVWSYWNYTNNPVYNCQFALGSRGWEISRARVEEHDGSSQMKLQRGGHISQTIGTRIAGKLTHENYVRFTADSDSPVTVAVTLGNVTKEVQVSGKKQFDLDFGRLFFEEVRFEARGDVYLDNIEVYNFIQDGQLYGIDGEELSSMSAMRELNRRMD